MALTVNLRHLETKNVDLKGELTPQELELDEINDELIRIDKPAEYDLTVQKLDENLVVEGVVTQEITARCVRCLKEFQTAVEFPTWTAYIPLEGEDAASVSNDLVDLTPFLREDILLGFPQHPLCKEDCGGLPSPVEAPKTDKKGSPAWEELNKLKFE